MGTVPVPYSPVAGDDATQARVLTWADAAAYLLGSATSGGSKRPNCVMRQTVAQSLATAASAAITFDVEEFDYDNGHSTVTNTSRYTAATAGVHHVDFGFAIAANAAGQREAFLKVNGVAVPASLGSQSAVSAGDITAVTGSRSVFLNVGDFLELFGFQNSGGALLTSVTAQNASYMCVEWRSN